LTRFRQSERVGEEITFISLDAKVWTCLLSSYPLGLYLNPTEHALVLSVDEKSQIQALDRTQPILPLRPGLPELNVAIAQCQPRHRHQEFLRFLLQIEGATDPELQVHLILDNYGTHKHPQVKKWFTAHRRYQVHFTPPRPVPLG
jgi:hypothetical protein